MADCNICSIYERALVWILTQFLKRSGDSVIKARLALQTETISVQENVLTSLTAIVNFLLVRYTKDKKTNVIDSNI